MDGQPKVTAKKSSGVIFRKWITVNGVRIYAKDKGLKAFPIRLGKKK